MKAKVRGYINAILFYLFGHKWEPVRWRYPGKRWNYGFMCCRTRKVYDARSAWRLHHDK